MSILQEKLARYRNSEFIFEISTTELDKNDIFHRCNQNFIKNCIPVKRSMMIAISILIYRELQME